MMTISELWKSLEAEAATVSSEGYLTRRILPSGKCDLSLAIETPSGIRMLMLRVQRSSSVQNITFPTSGGFKVRKRVLPGDETDHVTLQLVLKHKRFEDVFTALVQDVSELIAPVQVEREAIHEMVSRLRRWQLFLEQRNPEGLSKESQHGLYGELWALRQVVISQLGSTGVKYWVGPAGESQDFQFPEYAIEVKTTVTQSPQRLSISSEHQLDDSLSKEIVILHLAVDCNQGLGETLPEIIEDLRLCFGDENHTFEKLLFEAGYLEIHAPKYSHQGYSSQTASFYQVADGFPRLTPVSLPDGVTQVRYAIRLSRCQPFAVSETKVLSRVYSFRVEDSNNA